MADNSTQSATQNILNILNGLSEQDRKAVLQQVNQQSGGTQQQGGTQQGGGGTQPIQDGPR